MIKKNTEAPFFELLDQNNNLVSLTDYHNKTIVLYFYPKDDTPGCTTQACSYRDNRSLFDERNTKIIGISRDDVDTHNLFINKYNLNFTLLSDPELEVIPKYGAWVEKTKDGNTYMGIARTTFIIKDGIIKEVFENVDPESDVDLVIKAIDLLNTKTTN